MTSRVLAESGLHRAIAERVLSLAGKTGVEPPATVVGGVAKNPGVIHFIEQNLGSEIRKLPLDAQIASAFGAALLAGK